MTGGARGLGAHISRAFLGAGARVVIAYHRSGAAAEALAAEHPGRALPVAVDIRDRGRVDELVEATARHFGEPVTTVVNNALVDFTFDGDARPKAHELTAARLAEQFAGSVHGPLHLVQAAQPGMAARGFGRIVNIGTNLVQHPVVPYHDYTAAKAAAAGADPHARRTTWGRTGSPSTWSPAGCCAPPTPAPPPRKGYSTPSPRPPRWVASPRRRSCADAVLFFASPWARAVTGQNLIVDGGLVKG